VTGGQEEDGFNVLDLSQEELHDHEAEIVIVVDFKLLASLTANASSFFT
jgi:hypothetical protein